MVVLSFKDNHWLESENLFSQPTLDTALHDRFDVFVSTRSLVSTQTSNEQRKKMRGSVRKSGRVHTSSTRWSGAAHRHSIPFAFNSSKRFA